MIESRNFASIYIELMTNLCQPDRTRKSPRMLANVIINGKR